MMMSTDESKDITIRSLLELQNNDNELITFFPYVTNEKAIKLKLERINEYSNGLEAVLTCKYKNETEIHFYDADYFLHKGEYKTGEYYSFTLSALTYYVKRVPQNELSITIKPEDVENIFENAPEMIEKDEAGNTLPMTLQLDQTVSCLQLDGRYPDNGEFQSPVISRVRSIKFLNHDFYRMEIKIYQDEDSDFIAIPLIARKDFFDEPLKKGTAIKGHLWLQGKLIDIS